VPFALGGGLAALGGEEAVMEAMSPLRLMTRAVRFSQTRVRMSAASSP
jgi:glutamate-1-semialdehyde aminotransferase